MNYRGAQPLHPVAKTISIRNLSLDNRSQDWVVMGGNRRQCLRCLRSLPTSDFNLLLFDWLKALVARNCRYIGGPAYPAYARDRPSLSH